jgi:Asp-tRNA(Asn)/Glu-tRNA(Gln) amidotransferase A subunit family amidase
MPSLKIGIAKSALFEDVEPDVAHAVHNALDVFKDAGAQVVSIEIGGADAARVDCSTVMHVEALAEHETRPSDYPTSYGDAVRRRLDIGGATSAIDYTRASTRRMNGCAQLPAHLTALTSLHPERPRGRRRSSAELT